MAPERNDIFNVTVNTTLKSIDNDPIDDEGAGWAHGNIGNDLIEDLGSGYDWLTAGMETIS